MDAESRRLVRAGDGWLLNWPWSSLPQRGRTTGNGDREPVGQDGDLTVIRGLSACVRQHEPEWYRAGIFSLASLAVEAQGFYISQKNHGEAVCCLDKGESSP
jgi:hypothetical protein